MSSFFTWSQRSTLSRMTLAAGLVLLVTMLLSACGGSSPSVIGGVTPTVTNTAARACSVSAADLGPGGSNKGTAPADKATGTVAIDGSSGLQTLVAQAATEYQKANTDAKITVNAGGSNKGLADVESGSVQIGMSDLFAKDVNATTYANLVDHQVGVVIFSVVVNPDVAAQITNLTSQQITAIFTGQITNWKELGGPDEPITAIDRPNGSEIRAMFTKYVLGGATTYLPQTVDDSSSAAGDAVSSTPGAISYIATSAVGTGGAYQGKIVPVCIDGFKPGPTDAANDNYKFWSFEHLYTKGEPTGLTKSFLAYLTSDAFQKNDLVGLYFMPTKQISSSAAAAHTP